jgi:hypothetical protein
LTQREPTSIVSEQIAILDFVKHQTPTRREDKQFPGARFALATLLMLVSLAALFWAFISQPHLSPHQRVLSNFFFALASGTAGFVWGNVLLHATGKLPGGVKFTIEAFGGSAIFLILTFVHPLFPSETSYQTPHVMLQRICGLPTTEGGVLAVGPACSVEGEVRGPIEPDTRLCVTVARHDAGLAEPPEATCVDVLEGRWSISRVVMREVGDPDATRAEVMAGLVAVDGTSDPTGLSSPVSIEVRAPEVLIEAVSEESGFRISGTAERMLQEEQVAVLVEGIGGERPTASILYSESNGHNWVARDHTDAAIAPARRYTLTCYIGPKAAVHRPFHAVPDGFHALGEPREFKRSSANSDFGHDASAYLFEPARIVKAEVRAGEGQEGNKQ